MSNENKVQEVIRASKTERANGITGVDARVLLEEMKKIVSDVPMDQ